MAQSNVAEWHKLPVSLTELCINTTLRCGQSFRWRKSSNDEWSCALHGRLLTLRQNSTHLHYRAIYPEHLQSAKPSKKSSSNIPTPPSSSPASTVSDPVDDTLSLLQHYLNLTPNLTSLYARWSAHDANFRKRVNADMHNLQGIRILKQDPWEALCGFICSSNNNIKRISLMMNRLCAHYGDYVGELKEEVMDLDAETPDLENVQVKEEDLDDMSLPQPIADTPTRDRKPKTKTIKVPYHDFPPPSALTAPNTEATLRQLGFGYRAKYIYQTACMVANKKGGITWLEGLMNPETSSSLTPNTPSASPISPEGRPGYLAAHAALLQLTGVGPKVADCVCLMGLGWGEAVPVDTHVWQIAVRDYKFGAGKGGKNASMTPTLYQAVGAKFRNIWGKEAGWAHSVLFTADLSDFKKKKIKVVVKEDEDGGMVVVKREVEEDGEEIVKEAEVRQVVKKRKAPRDRSTGGVVTQKVVVETAVTRQLDEGSNVLEGEDLMSRVKRRRRSGKP